MGVTRRHKRKSSLKKRNGSRKSNRKRSRRVRSKSMVDMGRVSRKLKRKKTRRRRRRAKTYHMKGGGKKIHDFKFSETKASSNINTGIQQNYFPNNITDIYVFWNQHLKKTNSLEGYRTILISKEDCYYLNEITKIIHQKIIEKFPAYLENVKSDDSSKFIYEIKDNYDYRIKNVNKADFVPTSKLEFTYNINAHNDTTGVSENKDETISILMGNTTPYSNFSLEGNDIGLEKRMVDKATIFNFLNFDNGHEKGFMGTKFDYFGSGKNKFLGHTNIRLQKFDTIYKSDYNSLDTFIKSNMIDDIKSSISGSLTSTSTKSKNTLQINFTDIGKEIFTETMMLHSFMNDAIDTLMSTTPLKTQYEKMFECYKYTNNFIFKFRLAAEKKTSVYLFKLKNELRTYLLPKAST